MQDVGKKKKKKIPPVCILPTHERRIYSHAQPLPLPPPCVLFTAGQRCVHWSRGGVKLTDWLTLPNLAA